MTINIYTDGSCLGNPGPGGWAYLIEMNGKELRAAEGEPHTTNNRMELTAVIQAIAYLHQQGITGEITVYSDSSWVINTMTKNWKKKKNLDLWEQLIPLVQGKNIKWQWVKGHSGHPQNEDCDERANNQAKQYSILAAKMDPEDLRLPGDAPTLF